MTGRVLFLCLFKTRARRALRTGKLHTKIVHSGISKVGAGVVSCGVE